MTAATSNPNPSPVATAAPAKALPVPAHDPSILQKLLDQPIAYRFALEPTTFDEGWRISSIVAKLNMCGVKTAEDGFARIMIGRPIGLPAMASIQGIALIWSKKNETHLPCMYSKLKVALCLSRPDKIEYIEPKIISNERAIWVAKRVGGRDEIPYEFTIEDARIAELVDRGTPKDHGHGGNNYNLHPKAMLSWRASGRLCDIIAGDILNGLATREDIEYENEQLGLVQTPAERLASAQAAEFAERQLAEAKQAKGAPPRDYGKDAEALKSRIRDCKSEADQKTLRDDVKAFGADPGAGPYYDEIKKAYNDVFYPGKGPEVAPSPQTQAPSTVPTGPRPEPTTDDLFGPVRG